LYTFAEFLAGETIPTADPKVNDPDVEADRLAVAPHLRNPESSTHFGENLSVEFHRTDFGDGTQLVRVHMHLRLWNAGNGTIVRPELDQIFLPTSLHGSTLRDQLLLIPHPC